MADSEPHSQASERTLTRAALERDAAAVLRFGAPCFALLMAIEGASHLGRGGPTMVVVPWVSSLALVVLSLALWRGAPFVRWAAAWILLPWALSMIGIALHVEEHDPGLVLAFTTMSLLTAAGLLMPTISIAIAGPLTLAFQFFCAAQVDSQIWIGAFLVPTFTIPIATVLYLSRRRSIVLAERQRRIELEMQARTELSERLDRMTAMAGGAVHHFNNLLSGVIGGSELALEELPDTHPAHSSVSLAHESAVRAADLIARLHAFTGRRSFDRTRLDLAELLAVENLPDLPDGVSLEVDLAQDLPPVLGDRALLLDAISALVENAAQSADRRPATIDLVARDAGNGTHVVLRVSDTGQGIAEEHWNRVHEPFFTTRGPQHSGLGLSLATGVARQHGGALSIESKPGSGTQVSLELPAAPDPAPPGPADGASS